MSTLITSYNRSMVKCNEDVNSFLSSIGTESTFKFLFNTLQLHLNILFNFTKRTSIMLVPNYEQFHSNVFLNFNNRRFDILFFQNDSKKFLNQCRKNPFRKKILICNYTFFEKFTQNILPFISLSEINFILCDDSHLISQQTDFLLSHSFKRVKKLYFSSQPTREQRKKKYHYYDEMTFVAYDTIDVPDDGNCFFHCLSKFMKKPHNEIRLECVNFFLKQKDIMKDYGLEKKNIEMLYEDGIWNTNEFDLLPKIASKLYNRTIFIHKKDSEFVETFFRDSRRKPIYLCLKNFHYNIILHNELTQNTIIKKYLTILNQESVKENLYNLIPLKILSKHREFEKERIKKMCIY